MFNQENHVHATAVVCKKTDAGQLAFCKVGNVFDAVENKQNSLNGV